MKSRKALYVIIVILLLIATAIGFFFLGRASYKNSLMKNNVDYNYNDKDNKLHKTYTLNETIIANTTTNY